MVVAVVAHPDDESLIAGGTLALAARAGHGTGVVSLTRGEHGPIADPRLADRATLPARRERELRDAGRELGVDWARCLRLPDGELPWTDHSAAAAQLRELLCARPPDVVLTFGEDGLYGHPDHVAAAEIARCAAAGLAEPADVYTAAWPAGLVAGLARAARARALPTGLWGLEPEDFGSDAGPAVTVDVRPVLARKLAAIRAHRTQIGPDHLFASLPLDLAEELLGVEPWAGPAAGRLARLVCDG